MPLNFELIKVMTVLSPGFITYSLVSYFTYRKKPVGVNLVFEILLWSFLCFFFSFIVNSIPLSGLGDLPPHISKWTIIWAFIFSVLFGTIVSLIMNKNLIYRAKFLRFITKKTGYPSIWDEIMDITYDHVMIKYTNGELYSGKIQNFNSYPERPMLYLVNVKVWNEFEDVLQSTDMDVKGLFVVNIDKIEFIIVLDNK